MSFGYFHSLWWDSWHLKTPIYVIFFLHLQVSLMWVSTETDQTSKGLSFCHFFYWVEFCVFVLLFFFWVEISWNFQVVKRLMHLCFISYVGLLVLLYTIMFVWLIWLWALLFCGLVLLLHLSLVLLLGLLDNLWVL